MRISSVWLCALAFGSTGGRDFFSPDLASLSLPDTPFRVLHATAARRLLLASRHDVEPRQCRTRALKPCQK